MHGVASSFNRHGDSDMLDYLPATCNRHHSLELKAFALKPLHVLHSESATGWGGQEIRVFQESRLLMERGFRVSIVCQPASALAERCRTVVDPNFGFYPLPMNSPVSLSALWALCTLMKKIKPDILHTHSSVDSWLVSLCGRWMGIPIVRSRHVSIPVKNYFPKNWIYTSFPARIITSGESISAEMTRLSGITADKVVSISAGVDMRRFDFNISGESVRAELKVSPGRPLIGKVGVVRGWKGHDYFIEAIPLVLQKFPDARFVIVGSGPGFAQISQKVQDRGLSDSVTLLGHREDIPQIMAALDVLVLASTAGEGTPQVIPQAFSMKTPVVATRVASIPTLLNHGERGVLVKSKNPQSLADGILEVLQNPAKSDQLVTKAYEFCKQELTIEKMIDQTIAVYNDVFSAKK